MRDALRGHHDDFPLKQPDLFVLADDAGFHHAADILDRECSAGETFGGCGHGNAHDRNFAGMPKYNTYRDAVRQPAASARSLPLVRANNLMMRREVARLTARRASRSSKSHAGAAAACGSAFCSATGPEPRPLAFSAPRP